MDYLQLTIDIEQLAQILHKTPDAILVDRSHPKRKYLIPPAIQNTGKKLIWSLETVKKWLQNREEKIEPTNKDFLTLKEVAQELNCAIRTIHNNRKKLPFPTVRVLGSVKVARKHFEDYKNRITAESELQFEQEKGKGLAQEKRGRGRPRKLPNFTGLGRCHHG